MIMIHKSATAGDQAGLTNPDGLDRIEFATIPDKRACPDADYDAGSVATGGIEVDILLQTAGISERHLVRPGDNQCRKPGAAPDLHAEQPPVDPAKAAEAQRQVVTPDAKQPLLKPCRQSGPLSG